MMEEQLWETQCHNSQHLWKTHRYIYIFLYVYMYIYLFPVDVSFWFWGFYVIMVRAGYNLWQPNIEIDQ